MIQKLLQRVFKHFDIVKTVDGVETLYLRRYYLLETRWGNIFLHNICRSDDDPDPHDHPWNFLTIILKGSYVDEAYTFLAKDLSVQGGQMYELPYGSNSREPIGWVPSYNIQKGYRGLDGIAFTRETVKPFQPRYRPATHIHRLKLEKPVWSLVFTGKTFRAWGFVKEDSWVFWREYLNVWDSGINP